MPVGSIVGVGTGSTANFFIDELAKIKHKIEGAVASSEASAQRLKRLGIEVLDLNDVDELPVYVDGADEITRHLAMIKGGGGALTREKIVAAVARKFVCIADAVQAGRRARQVPAAGRGDSDGAQSMSRANSSGSAASRCGGADFTTDNGNVILDVHNLQITRPPSSSKPRSTRSPAWSPTACSRGAAPTCCCWARPTACRP